MRINKLSSLVGLSAVLLLGPLTATAAQAKGPGIYFGGSWGAYSIKRSSLNDNDHVVKIFVGGQFNDWFGVEGSWNDFNRIDNSGDRFDADGKGLAAVLSMPMGTVSSAFIKAGQFWWDSASSLGGTSGASSGNDPFWGAGFKFGFNNNFSLRLEAERYDVAETNIDTYTVGLEFKF